MWNFTDLAHYANRTANINTSGHLFACTITIDPLPIQFNTFQAVLVSSTNGSYVFFIYGDVQSGSGANIGFNPSRLTSAPGSRPFMIPQALTNATVDIETTSNAGIPGLYAFRVDGASIIQPGGAYWAVF